jgi:hypothetical protein
VISGLPVISGLRGDRLQRLRLSDEVPYRFSACFSHTACLRFGFFSQAFSAFASFCDFVSEVCLVVFAAWAPRTPMLGIDEDGDEDDDDESPDPAG